MAARYQIRLKDQAGAVVAIITDWRTLTYTRRVNGVDQHSLQIDGDLPVVDLFVLDGQVEVWRSDVAAGGGAFPYVFPFALGEPFPPIDWYLDYEGFHRTPVRFHVGGLSGFTSVGVGYDHLLARRAILHRVKSAGAAKTGVGETVMKAYVNENAGPGATAPPRLFAGVFADLTIQADGAAGSAWEGDRGLRALLDVVKEIAEATTVDFGIVGTGPATFEFQAKARPFGLDRTTVGLDPVTGLNAANNVPVIFSLEFGNMEDPSFAVVRTEEITAAIVLGQGGEGNRVVDERTSAAVTDSPWNRIEGVANANQEAAAAGLDAVGDAILDRLQAKESFQFGFMQIPSTLYGREYFIGDTVTARYKTLEVNVQIVAVTVVVAQGQGETISVELANVP